MYLYIYSYIHKVNELQNIINIRKQIMSGQICNKCTDLQKKLRLTISDYQFQLKKIQQDKSTDKALYQIHLQKQVRKFQELYNKQKGQRQDQNKNWMDKYESMNKKYEQDIKQLKQRHYDQFNKNTKNMSEQHNSKIIKLTSQYQQKITKLTTNYDKLIDSLNSQKQDTVIKIKSQHQQYCTQIKKAHKSFLDQSTKNYESKVLAVECEKVKQYKMHQNTKNQSREIQSKLYQQIFGLNKKINELQIKLADQTKETNGKNQKIQELMLQIININQNNAIQIQIMQRQKKKQLQQNKLLYKEKLSQIQKQNLEYCNKYEMAIQKIQQRRQSQKVLFLNHIDEINNFIQNRVSRPQDVQAIQTLKQVLIKKCKQCQVLSQELKFFRLQLENKQETYNKIFTPVLHPINQNTISKRKEFKLRRQGKSVTTVREAMLNVNSVMMGERKNTALLPPKPKIL